jgi:hypothetical protein
MAWIEFVCRADHAADDGLDYIPMVTVFETKWGWCLSGGSGRHDWRAIPPTAPGDCELIARPAAMTAR